jgi:hypothetical protein
LKVIKKATRTISVRVVFRPRIPFSQNGMFGLFSYFGPRHAERPQQNQLAMINEKWVLGVKICIFRKLPACRLIEGW